MRKTSIFLLCFLFIILCFFTAVSATKVFRFEFELPQAVSQKESQYRLVLITHDMDTPFWDKVGNAALQQAKKEGVSLEIWGSYANNNEEFLRNLEIAIRSKVDGIIIQGLDTEEFKELTKVKASSYGIPVITVVNDVPMTDSLRRTYVGSDHYLAGRLIAEELISDMGSTGNVILMSDHNQEYFQEQRLKGIQDVLKQFPNVKTLYAETSETREEVISTTQDMLNRIPDVNAIIAVNASVVGPMIQEISKRSQIEPYHIYSFDDGPESLSLLEQGKLDAIIQQSPEMMGKLSVQLVTEWLEGETVPLDPNGYLTDIHILKAVDIP